jgi:lipoyl(octanoyl) transferase
MANQAGGAALAGAASSPLASASGPEFEVSEGLVDYEAAVARMEAQVDAIRAGRAGDLVWLLQHPPLYTAGTSASPDELLEGHGLPVYPAGRGGRYTYHGPGQRVAYILLDLKRYGTDVRRHVWRLEELVIRTLADFEVTGLRREGRVGVWVETPAGEAKIAAIGVRVRRWVSYHGLAINVAPDLRHYAGIVPCGIREFGVTSLQALGKETSMATVDARLRHHFGAIFVPAA